MVYVMLYNVLGCIRCDNTIIQCNVPVCNVYHGVRLKRIMLVYSSCAKTVTLVKLKDQCQRSRSYVHVLLDPINRRHLHVH
jgi:hypothetical protein